MTPSLCLILAFIASLSLTKDNHLFCNGNPTNGFTAMTLTEKNFQKQWPYNLPLDDRYSYVNGVRRLWVYSTDKPHAPTSATKPRTEIRISVIAKNSVSVSLVHTFTVYLCKFCSRRGMIILQGYGNSKDMHMSRGGRQGCASCKFSAPVNMHQHLC